MDFEDYINTIEETLCALGNVQTKAINYGAQIILTDAGKKVTLNIYNGKKGIRLVWGGGDSELQKKAVALEDLAPYPRLSYEQGSHNSFYFSEEILSTMDCDKELVVRDRASLFNMLIGLNGYTICSGIISPELNGTDIVSIPLAIDDYMDIGYILPSAIKPSVLTQQYIRILSSLTPQHPQT